jgi:proline iminopeptidase
MIHAAPCDLEGVSDFMDSRGFKLKYFSWKPKGRQALKPALIGLHGGPGGNHWELYTLRLLACTGRQVVLYDQVGAGESDRPSREQAPWLFTLEYYVEELDTVATTLGLNNFYILGHSWGGIVTQMYAIRRNDDVRLKGLILASIFSDADLYIKVFSVLSD